MQASIINTDHLKGLKLLIEEQFIINCLHSEFGGENNSNEYAKINPATVDWNKVYEKSIQCGITPLLYKIIKKRPSYLQFLNIPNYFLEKIKEVYLRTFLVNEKNFNNLVKVLNIFNAEGIKVILLKGCHLANFIYQDIGLRPMSDIDIMIKNNDIDKAEELLLKNGYEYINLNETTYTFHGTSNDAEGRARFIKICKTTHHHLLPFSNPNGIRHLEIHKTISLAICHQFQFNIDIEGLWERAKSGKLNGTDVLMLSPEDILLHISIHTSYDYDKFKSGLKSYCDIATIVNRYYNEIDWNELQLRVHKWGIEKCFYLSLCLAKEILGLTLPDSILHTLNQPKFLNRKIVLEAITHIISLHNKKSAFVSLNHPDLFVSDIGIMKKISYVLRRIFPPVNELAFRYSVSISSKRIYFYYFVRFFSILYNKTFFFARFFSHLLFRRKTDFYDFNLDTWLIPPDSENIKKAN